jgi:hypothetical protein
MTIHLQLSIDTRKNKLKRVLIAIDTGWFGKRGLSKQKQS